MERHRAMAKGVDVDAQVPNLYFTKTGKAIHLAAGEKIKELAQRKDEHIAKRDELLKIREVGLDEVLGDADGLVHRYSESIGTAQMGLGAQAVKNNPAMKAIQEQLAGFQKDLQAAVNAHRQAEYLTNDIQALERIRRNLGPEDESNEFKLSYSELVYLGF